MAETIKMQSALSDGLQKVELNSYGDFIYINTNDAGIFDRFARFVQELNELDRITAQKEAELREKFPNGIKDDDGINVEAFLEMSAARTSLYGDVVEKIDSIFGKGTIRKYFRVMYEAYDGFVPDEECITEFLDNITEVLNGLFEGRRNRLERRYNAKRKGANSTNYRAKRG